MIPDSPMPASLDSHIPKPSNVNDLTPDIPVKPTAPVMVILTHDQAIDLERLANNTERMADALGRIARAGEAIQFSANMIALEQMSVYLWNRKDGYPQEVLARWRKSALDKLCQVFHVPMEGKR